MLPAEESVELEVVGEAACQRALSEVAGLRNGTGDRPVVRARLRVDQVARNRGAVRVEVGERHVGDLRWEQASQLARPLLERSDGEVEVWGRVIGGWDAPEGEPRGRGRPLVDDRLGIRVWIATEVVRELGLRPADLDPTLRPAWPALPMPGSGEVRLTPRQGAQRGTVVDHVALLGEEEHQEALLASMPLRWQPDWSWPVLVTLRRTTARLAGPEASDDRIEVLLDGERVGELPAPESGQYLPLLDPSVLDGRRATAEAVVALGFRSGRPLHRVRVALPGLR